MKIIRIKQVFKYLNLSILEGSIVKVIQIFKGFNFLSAKIYVLIIKKDSAEIEKIENVFALRNWLIIF